MSSAPIHPSIGRPFRWVLVGGPAFGHGALGPAVSQAESIGKAGGDALVLDWMAASYLAPGVKPRPHAIVVRAREERPPELPSLLIVTASYSAQPSGRPSRLEMARTEGRLVGDAIVVARSIGIELDTAVVEYAVFEKLARNEQIDVEIAAREFLSSAVAALKPTAPK